MENIQVILVRPDEDANIGAVCRAMKNMGLKRLVLVTDRQIDENRVRTLAIHAFDIFTSAVRYSGLEPALRTSVLSAGMTRRTGKRRKYVSFTPEELAERIYNLRDGSPDSGGGPDEISLIFGNEEHGLTDEELACCDTAVHIPSSPEFPSLNLSHAVQIVAYELAKKLSAQPRTGRTSACPDLSAFVPPLSRQQLAGYIEDITGSLRQMGFFSFSGLEGKEDTGRFFRDILARAGISEGEVRRLRAIFSKCAGLAKKGTGQQ